MCPVWTRSTLVPGEGFEPPTNGLQNRCSTPELTRLPLGYLPARVQASKSASYRVSGGGTKAPESAKSNQHRRRVPATGRRRRHPSRDLCTRYRLRRAGDLGSSNALGNRSSPTTISSLYVLSEQGFAICAERARLRGISADGKGLTVRSPPDADS